MNLTPEQRELGRRNFLRGGPVRVGFIGVNGQGRVLVRTGSKLLCSPELGLGAARACIAGFEAIDSRTRVVIEA